MIKELLGIWKSDPDDWLTRLNYGNVMIEFKENGELIYSIFADDAIQKIFMTFEIRDNVILSDHPTSPGKVETLYRILADGRLELVNDGIKSRYSRCNGR